MIIPQESFSRVFVFRSCWDRRSLPPELKLYPSRRKSYETAEKQARDNLDFAWIARGTSSRYSDGSWSVLYTARRAFTTYSEVGFHLQQTYSNARKPGVRVIVAHIVYAMSVWGKKQSFLHCSTHLPLFCKEPPEGYIFCQNIGRIAVHSSVNYLEVPSARDVNGICIPVLSERSVSKPFRVKEYFLELLDDIRFIHVHFEKKSLKCLVFRN